MKTQTEILFVDTNIIPDRNAGIGSLLLDLQNFQVPDSDGPPLLSPEFAFIDVGVSRAKVSTTLKTLLARDLRMNVDYVATELLEIVPYANITPPGDRAEMIRRYLSGMISTKENMREVTDWHYVVNQKGKVSSVSYSYNQQRNEIWEAYYMGKTFMVSGEKVEFHDSTLDKLLAPDISIIEAKIDLEKKRDYDSGIPVPSWNGYRMEKYPLEAGLAECGITLQKTDVPQRIKNRQNVLYLGNVLNHYPQDEQNGELDRIAMNMQEGDIVIVQGDEIEASFIEVLHVKGLGARKTFERVRWINTGKLEVRKLVRGQGTWQQIQLKPELERIVNRLIDCIGRKVIPRELNQKNYMVFVYQYINQVFKTFFRALPVEETLRIAIRESLRRLPSGAGLNGIPVFKDDAKDVYGGSLGIELSPIVSETDFITMMMAPPKLGTNTSWTTCNK